MMRRLARMHTPRAGGARRWRLRSTAVDRRVLDALVAEGFVEARPRPDGAAGYYLTESGRRLLDE